MQSVSLFWFAFFLQSAFCTFQGRERQVGPPRGADLSQSMGDGVGDNRLDRMHGRVGPSETASGFLHSRPWMVGLHEHVNGVVPNAVGGTAPLPGYLPKSEPVAELVRGSLQYQVTGGVTSVGQAGAGDSGGHIKTLDGSKRETTGNCYYDANYSAPLIDERSILRGLVEGSDVSGRKEVSDRQVSGGDSYVRGGSVGGAGVGYGGENGQIERMSSGESGGSLHRTTTGGTRLKSWFGPFFSRTHTSNRCRGSPPQRCNSLQSLPPRFYQRAFRTFSCQEILTYGMIRFPLLAQILGTNPTHVFRF